MALAWCWEGTNLRRPRIGPRPAADQDRRLLFSPSDGLGRNWEVSWTFLCSVG